MAITYQIVDADPLDIFLGVCRQCQRPKRETDTGFPLSAWADKHTSTCPQCNGNVAMERVYGIEIGMGCDDRCTSATGSHCECACGGVNHGGIWSEKDQILAGALASYRATMLKREERKQERRKDKERDRVDAYRAWRQQSPQKELVDYLHEYYKRVKAGTEPYVNRFFDSLIADQLMLHRPLTDKQLTAAIRTMERRQYMDRKRIERAAAAPAVEVPKVEIAPSGEVAAREKVKPGVFRWRGETFVVKPNRAGTSCYANTVVPCTPRVNAYGVTISTELKYAPGVWASLTEDMRLSEEDFKEFIVQYGRCLCGRSLKRERSLRIMMGKRCATKYGVKW